MTLPVGSCWKENDGVLFKVIKGRKLLRTGYTYGILRVGDDWNMVGLLNEENPSFNSLIPIGEEKFKKSLIRAVLLGEPDDERNIKTVEDIMNGKGVA